MRIFSGVKMNRFVKKHYHMISFVILVVIFVAWGVLQSYVFPEGSFGVSAENEGGSSETSLSSSLSSMNTVTETDTSAEDPYLNNDADNSAVVAPAGSDVSVENEPVTDPDPTESAHETKNVETSENIPDTTASPEPETVNEPEPDAAPVEEVILEEGTYGPGEGKMPFDLCLANVRESLNVRSGPGEENEVIAKFLPVDYARVLEKGSEWSLITSGEITGYAHNDYLITGEKAIKKLADSDKLCVTVIKKLINVRAEKSTDAEVLRQAKMGETFKCIPSESDSEWFAIKYDDGNTAYVATTLAHVTAEMDTIDSLTPVG